MAANPTQAGAQPAHDQIAERARKLWIERGSPGGRDLEHWLDAERQLRDELKNRRAGSPSRQDESNEAEKRLDGLIENAPQPARRTPKGEQL